MYQYEPEHLEAHSDQWVRISHDNIIKTHQDIATLRPEKHVFSVK